MLPDFYSFLFTPLAYVPPPHTCGQTDFSHWVWKLKMKPMICKHRELGPELRPSCSPTWGSGFNVTESSLRGGHRLCLAEVGSSGKMWWSPACLVLCRLFTWCSVPKDVAEILRKCGWGQSLPLHHPSHWYRKRRESYCRNSARKMTSSWIKEPD